MNGIAAGLRLRRSVVSKQGAGMLQRPSVHFRHLLMRANMKKFWILISLAMVFASPAIAAEHRFDEDKKPEPMSCQTDIIHQASLAVIEDLKRTNAQKNLAPDVVGQFMFRMHDKLNKEHYKRPLPLLFQNYKPGTLYESTIINVIKNCFPELEPLMIEQRALIEAEAAKREAAKKAAEQAEWQRWATSPEGKRQLAANRLLQAYGYFAKVQFCYQVRDGYAVVYISGPEYERSHDAVKAIEKSVLAEQPDLNSSDIWQQAVRQMKNENWYANSNSCSSVRIALYNMSPKPVYQYPKP